MCLPRHFRVVPAPVLPSSEKLILFDFWVEGIITMLVKRKKVTSTCRKKRLAGKSDVVLGKGDAAGSSGNSPISPSLNSAKGWLSAGEAAPQVT